MDFDTWLYNLTKRGLGIVAHRYYGLYRGVVSDNKDPEGRGRVKIFCPQVGQTAAPEVWVTPATPGAGSGRGMFFPPEKDDSVWVSFYEGDPSAPEVYLGGWFGVDSSKQTEAPQGLKPPASTLPEKKGWTTRAGHSFLFNDEAGKESIILLWNKPADTDPAVKDRTQTAKLNPDKSAIFAFDKNGSCTIKTPSSYLFQMDDDKKTVTLTTPNGSMIHISKDDNINLVHKDGGSIAMSSTGIDVTASTAKQQDVNISARNVNINGGGVLLGGKAVDFAVLGVRLIKWLSTHVHGTALGPTTPSLVPPTPADFLSKTVKVQD